MLYAFLYYSNIITILTLISLFRFNFFLPVELLQHFMYLCVYFFIVAAVKTSLCFTFVYQKSNSKDLGYSYVSPPVISLGGEFVIYE